MQWMIAWGNLKPATVLIALQSFSSLGRFDLDGYLVGYLIFFSNGKCQLNIFIFLPVKANLDF